MVHMSSHIDVRRGRWEEAIVANTRAIAINRSYREQVGRPLSGYLNYMGHDYHMRTYAAMMGGQGALAAQTMKDLFAQMPPEWGRESDIGDGYFAMHFDVMKRFGKWDEILAAPEPIERYQHARAWRFLARGVARQLADGGRVRRGWLGVNIQQVTDEIAESLGLRGGAR
eukprot:gene838-1052_t